MTIRIVSLIGALLAALVAVPSVAQEAALSPHSLEFEKTIEPEGIAVQDLSGGVGSQDGGAGGGSVIQILQLQPGSSTNGVSTSASAPRFTSR